MRSLNRRPCVAVRRVVQRVARRSFASLIVALVVCQIHAAAHAQEKKRLLVIYELNRSSPAVELMDAGIQKALVGQSVDLYVEFMQTNLFHDAQSQKEIQDLYTRKYRQQKPSVIIAVGPSAVNFMLDAHRTLFVGIPLVFCGSMEDLVSVARREPDITGVWMRPDPKATLDLALKLRPRTNNVFVVDGSGKLDTAVADSVRNSVQDFYHGAAITYLTALPMPELLSRLQRLPNDSVVLFGAITEDPSGRQYTAATESLPLVIGSANAPVFVMADMFVGNGAVGGRVVSYAAQGRVAGEDALRLLNGEKAASIPVVLTVNENRFDASAMTRWNIALRLLPADRILLNQHATLWTRYWRLLLLLAALALAIIVIGIQRIVVVVGKHALKEQIDDGLASTVLRLDLTRRLLNAQETERSRIARELHDGVGQEIALLGIQMLQKPVRGAEEQVESTKMEEFSTKLAVIGSRLSSLSHLLHSSELELLGFQVAVEKLCREFSESGSTKLTSTCVGLSRDLDREVALSCFRLLQESLHNIAKHSGATAGSVVVTQQGRQLIIVVNDNGRGFDISEAKRLPGLGLLSMRERMSLINGIVEITSVPHEGTSVTAIVLLQSAESV
jgi:signal transduction histidine kinase